MKYIITENRLNDVIFKFLDFNYGALEPKKDIMFGYPLLDTVRLRYPDPEKGTGEIMWRKSGDLSINYEIMAKISNYFGIENDDSLRIIGKWVEDRYNLKVINTEFFTKQIQY
jgi:hypothetical protein